MSLNINTFTVSILFPVFILYVVYKAAFLQLMASFHLNLCFFQGVDLRQYSKQVEDELQRIEQASIKDCIHSCMNVLKELVHYLW